MGVIIGSVVIRIAVARIFGNGLVAPRGHSPRTCIAGGERRPVNRTDAGDCGVNGWVRPPRGPSLPPRHLLNLHGINAASKAAETGESGATRDDNAFVNMHRPAKIDISSM